MSTWMGPKYRGVVVTFSVEKGVPLLQNSVRTKTVYIVVTCVLGVGGKTRILEHKGPQESHIQRAIVPGSVHIT